MAQRHVTSWGSPGGELGIQSQLQLQFHLALEEAIVPTFGYMRGHVHTSPDSLLCSVDPNMERSSSHNGEDRMWQLSCFGLF